MPKKVKNSNPVHEFYCCECDPKEENPIKPENLKEHLLDAHNIYASEGTKELVMHIRRFPRSIYMYRCFIDNLVFLEVKS